MYDDEVSPTKILDPSKKNVLSDQAVVAVEGGKTWARLKLEGAMKEDLSQEQWYKDLKKDEEEFNLFEHLKAKQKEQGDMHELEV